MRAFFDAQTQVFDHVGAARGWMFYSWKVADYAEWSYSLAQTRNGWLQRTLGEYKFDLDTLCAGI
jgi:hypothetical protein